MFEDRSSTYSFEITRNEKQNSSNKLMSHFQNSSFLAQQQELSMFIKNLPIIRIEEVNSLNKLIELLIRQNQALGNKCQQNVLTVKEMFNKHQELIRANHQLQKQLAEKKVDNEQQALTQQQIESYYKIIEQHELKLEQTKKELKNKEESLSDLSQQTQQLSKQNQILLQWLQQSSELFKLIAQRNYKRSAQKIKELSSRPSQQGNMSWNDLQALEKYIKEEKKKAKYLPKVRETVESFCHRSIKVFEFADIQTIKEQLKKQIQNLLNIIDDLLMCKKKNNLSTSQSRLVQSNYRYDFFEGMIEKMIKEHQTSSQTKDEIAHELAVVREELQQSKKYYEHYLIESKIEFEKVLREKQQQLIEKTQVLQFYQGERQKTAKEQMQFRNRTILFEETLKAQKANLSAKEEQLATLQSKFDILKGQYSIKQKQIREQWDENIKTYEYKLTQKQELIEQQQKQRKNQKVQFDYQIAQLKQRLAEYEEKERNLISTNKQLNEIRKQLEDTLQKIQKQLSQETTISSKQISQKNRMIEDLNRKRQKQLQQIKKVSQQCEELQKQKNLQTAFIKELQIKNKQLSTKIKTIENKKNEEKTAKKEMNAIKQTILQQKKYCRQLEETIHHQKEQTQKQKEQNQRLKAVIKEMKKQLQEVYHQFNSLKLIESDRQKLLVQMDKSDRNREELYRSYESLKIQLAKTQQENKGLALEAKHYRNALSRIQALKF